MDISFPALAGLGGVMVAALARAATPGDGWYLLHSGTDWNAVRRHLGYEVAPAAPSAIVPATAQRRLLGYWPLLTDWDKERARLGYEPTCSLTDLITPPPQRGVMALAYRLLVRLATAWTVLVGALFGLAATAGGPGAVDSHVAALVILGPALLAATLAWIIKPA